MEPFARSVDGLFYVLCQLFIYRLTAVARRFFGAG
jgi:hypothetical protein